MSKLFIIFILLSLLIAVSLILGQSPFIPKVEPTLTSSAVKEDLSLPALTVENIFNKKSQLPEKLAEGKIITMIATGDVIPARTVNAQTIRKGDFKWAFSETASFLQQADITFINLETPLLNNCPVADEGMIFCGSNKHIEGLKLAGVDLASLANNHAGNYGEEGVMETVELLNSNNIKVIGVKGPAVVEIKGVKFAFLGYNDITAPQPGVSNVNEDKIKGEIVEAKKMADVVVVTVHWGVEYRNQPDDRQKYLAHFIIDAGADLIIGNHPHWIQPIEMYKDKLITYAHGNFVFDQMWSEETRLGVIGKYTFYGKQLIDVEFTPVQIFDFGQPRFITDPVFKNNLLEQMKNDSLISQGLSLRS